MEWGENPRAAGTVSARPYRSVRSRARGRKSVTVGNHGKAGMDVEDLYLRERESGDLHFFARRSFHAEDGQYMRIKTDAPVFLCTHGKTGVFFIPRLMAEPVRAIGACLFPTEDERA